MSDKKIKFDLSEDGELPFISGKTGFADILSIGALAHTKKRVYEPNRATLQYQTDEAGMEGIIHTTERALETINDIVNILGLLLVGDPNTINEHDINKAGWSFVALSELSAALIFEMNEMQFAQKGLADEKAKPHAATVTELKKGRH
ncbi:hypothetical protein [Candidatus Methylomicrobium oryzae]|uniref:hypothetical protein n=1 Tax=Candidatus Methylomicrobium oryzae TaxID=2802053 RepID=UPI0019226A30|nr:hypothetical protein [Methylomicrobium sp. RS1]MBL1263915.1 hypothetical protein [Methylomicrobium sp. RS1]